MSDGWRVTPGDAAAADAGAKDGTGQAGKLWWEGQDTVCDCLRGDVTSTYLHVPAPSAPLRGFHCGRYRVRQTARVLVRCRRYAAIAATTLRRFDSFRTSKPKPRPVLLGPGGLPATEC